MILFELVPLGIMSVCILLFGPIIFLLEKYTRHKKNDIKRHTILFIYFNSLMYFVLWMADSAGGEEIVSWAPIIWIALNGLLLGSFIIYKLTEPNT